MTKNRKKLLNINLFSDLVQDNITGEASLTRIQCSIKFQML